MDIVLIILSIIGIIFLIGFLLVLFAYIIERRRKRKQFEKDIENFYTEYDELFNKKK
jgi:heme/copper-type cytochrome/quinol oxidase subunit 2